jgi:hypothetical protein
MAIMNRSTATLALLAIPASATIIALSLASPARGATTAAATSATRTQPFVANFTETRTIPGVKQPLVLHGKLQFTPGRHLLWAVTKPYSYRFEIAGKHINEVMPDGSHKSEALAKTPWAQALFKLFSGLFSGDTHALARYFDIDKKAHALVLTPRSKVLAQWVTRITARGRPLPHKVIIEQSDGSRMRLELTPVGKVPVVAPPATTR